MGQRVEEETSSSPLPSSATSLSNAQRLTRRGLLALGMGSVALATTGGIGSAICSVSHSIKLQNIREECDEAMVEYVRNRVQFTGNIPPPEQWQRETIATLSARVMSRNWNSDGITSQGALRYLVGDFHFDSVTVDVRDPKSGKNVPDERWLGRCGCVARYAVLEAAKNGFADVRMYFASHPKKYRAICPLMMHYYPVIGKNDDAGFDPRFFVLTSKATGYQSFTPVREDNILSFLEKDYDGGNISLCMHAHREPIIPKRQQVMA